MSSWSEAVWVVRKLQKNFDFSQEIAKYETKLYNLDVRINNLIDRVEQDENDLKGMVVTFIRAKDSDNLPVDPPSYRKGAIWFVRTE